jgi:hypothetical protein
MELLRLCGTEIVFILKCYVELWIRQSIPVKNLFLVLKNVFGSKDNNSIPIIDVISFAAVIGGIKFPTYVCTFSPVITPPPTNNFKIPLPSPGPPPGSSRSTNR